MEYFSQSIVQPRVKDLFIQSIQNQRLAHAYIFYGQAGRGKEAFALELAKALNCEDEHNRPCGTCPSCIKIAKLNHPDVKFLFPVSGQIKSKNLPEIIKLKAKNPYAAIEIPGHKNIPIDAIRELKNEAKYAAFEAANRVFIIYGAEYFSREAANSFLKLLEEPPENLFIILITDELHRLLDTIRSRCQPVYFPDHSAEQIAEIVRRFEPQADDLDSLARIAQFNLKKIFAMLHSDYQQKRQMVYRFIKAAAADDMLLAAELIDAITQKRDKNYIIELLNLMILWMHDALQYSILQSGSEFTNIDDQETIIKFANYFAGADLGRLIDLAEQAAKHIGMNAHPSLTLTRLAFEIHEILSAKTSVKETV